MEGEKLTSCDENKNWLATRAARNLTLLPKQNLAKTTKTLTHTHHNEDWSTKKIQNLKQKVEAKEKTALFPDEKVSLPQPPFQPSISTMPTQLLEHKWIWSFESNAANDVNAVYEYHATVYEVRMEMLLLL